VAGELGSAESALHPLEDYGIDVIMSAATSPIQRIERGGRDPKWDDRGGHELALSTDVVAPPAAV